MAGDKSWYPAPENTLQSLRHGITMFDGIEFDIRITADNQLAIHHDRTVSLPPSQLEGRPKWTEEWTLDELSEVGFLGFEELLKDPTVHNHWSQEGKMGCIEIKRPHPKAPSGGGYFGRKHHIQHIAKAMKMASELLDKYEIPSDNTVFYSFHRHMPQSANQSETKRPWAALIPYIPPYGGRTFQRIKAFPKYFTTPFSKLIKTHLKQGSSMLPCAIEYFDGPTRLVPLGSHVSLKGKGLSKMTQVRKGMATYVWPTRITVEHDLIRAGLTALTDKANPNLLWLPSGHLRWNQPGTRPLDETQWKILEQATYENHRDVHSALLEATPTWKDCDAQRREILLREWKAKWNWTDSVESLLSRYNEATPPWSAPRIIGHRGSGKTSRPVLDEHHSI
ncbi:MAG TPA: glycerophosphodiester phosphodiesterase family protein [Poseidonia sp.]|nr:glycerophosphodiester phosphodiesterase family protein [Poseidonia sp.]